MTKGYKRATVAQTVEVAATIKDHANITMLGVEYHEGWDDGRVAEQVGASLSATARIRRDLYGPIYKPVIDLSGNGEPDTTDLHELSGEIHDLRIAMVAILESHNKLLAEFGKLPLELNF